MPKTWPCSLPLKVALCYAGLECDISVASGAARFKSTVLRYLADIDSRFSALVRLVKLWAGAHGMNDAAAGTFNSFALTLMVRQLVNMHAPNLHPHFHQKFTGHLHF